MTQRGRSANDAKKRDSVNPEKLEGYLHGFEACAALTRTAPADATSRRARDAL
jgi:hypothetical protein